LTAVTRACSTPPNPTWSELVWPGRTQSHPNPRCRARRFS